MDKEKYFKTKGVKGRYQQAIAAETAKALTLFCDQEPEFEQAIEEKGTSFQDCLDKITEGIKGSCSDLEVYKRAANFYFPGATVRFHMTINLVGEAAESAAETAAPPITMTKHKPESLSVSLDDLLNF
ncbi:MAG: hypothetical protein IJX77_07810 [Ruminococcus sp.]|nr:hypothetical protein [Ruminococcus sp.]